MPTSDAEVCGHHGCTGVLAPYERGGKLPWRCPICGTLWSDPIIWKPGDRAGLAVVAWSGGMDGSRGDGVEPVTVRRVLPHCIEVELADGRLYAARPEQLARLPEVDA